ncbi:MAG: hypothetical protein IPP71_01810 [Bacteroidetes bacterium]|nr:hypothetical protein [Bacteroidota bacterium]
MLWELPPWVLNLMTATVSTTGVLFFMFTLRLWNIRSVIPSGVALAFVPVLYINSTNLMDYTWTLSLVLVAMYFVAKRKIVVAAILLGMACGFRITAGAMVVAFGVLIYFQDRTIRQIVLLGIVTTTVAIICFIPVYATYGTSFFTYYEYFPYPPFLKNIYKASIGAWGVIGCVAVAVAVAVSFFSWRKMEVVGKNKKIPLIIMSTLTIVLYTYSFSKFLRNRHLYYRWYHL